MPRLIHCCDMSPEDGPVLDSQAYWVRLPDGTRMRDASGKLLAFKYRENAVQQAERVDLELARDGLDIGARAVPPELHEALFTVAARFAELSALGVLSIVPDALELPSGDAVPTLCTARFAVKLRQT